MSCLAIFFWGSDFKDYIILAMAVTQHCFTHSSVLLMKIRKSGREYEIDGVCVCVCVNAWNVMQFSNIWAYREAKKKIDLNCILLEISSNSWGLAIPSTWILAWWFTSKLSKRPRFYMRISAIYTPFFIYMFRTFRMVINSDDSMKITNFMHTCRANVYVP